MKYLPCILIFLLWSQVATANDAAQWAERELILVSDASGSMYPDSSSHYQLQRDGYISAFQDAEVRAALTAVPTAVRVVYFGGRVDFKHNIGPIFIRGPAEIDRLIELIRDGTPKEALLNGTNQCAGVNGAMATERVASVRIYDVVTDEVMYNEGADTCLTVRNRAEHQGDEINVLGIAQAADQYSREKFEEGLVTRTPRGFFMEAAGWADFSTAIKEKLLMELYG